MIEIQISSYEDAKRIAPQQFIEIYDEDCGWQSMDEFPQEEVVL